MNIEGVAKDALNTSERAYDIANEALNMDTSTQIERITKELVETFVSSPKN